MVIRARKDVNEVVGKVIGRACWKPSHHTKFASMKTRIHLTVVASVIGLAAQAQSHTKGTVQICLGASLGVHATHYEQSYTLFGLKFSDSDDDGAATSTFPIEFHYGLADRFSLGLYIEPGRYLDSADSNPNSVIAFGLTPRFYILNKDRFNWTGILDIGAGGLQIEDKDQTVKDYYAGMHFRLGTGVSFYFGDHFGLQLFCKYAAYSLKWRDRDPDIGLGDFEAKLTTSGFHFGGGLTVKFGG